jgi:hypothetical protein
MYNVTLRRVRVSLLPWKSSKYYNLNVCECVCPNACVHVALHIQHAKRMRHIVTSLMFPLAPPYFSTLSHNRTIFERKKKLLNVKCVS